MNVSNRFSIQSKPFDLTLFEHLQTEHYAKDFWPIVYILSDDKSKKAYIGETADVLTRMSTHLKNDKKKKLTSVHLIDSNQFNKSATLDIESSLIEYMSGDGKFQLINGNLGLANQNYYQKNELYSHIFRSIWRRLKTKGIVNNSLEYINNSDLFKYSPYKRLRDGQVEALKKMLIYLLEDKYESIIMEGGAGTGKTILAVFLFKLLNANSEDFHYKAFGDQEEDFIALVKKIKEKYPKLKMRLVVPMSSFRKTMEQVFKNISGLRANMVIGPAATTKEKFDILIIDESHRLRKRKSIGAYIGAFNNAAEQLGLNPEKTNELEWVKLQSKKTILFYDNKQSIKPSDVDQKDFDKLKKKKTTIVEKLKSQFRVLGGIDYVNFIDKMLHCKHEKNTRKFSSKKYEFILFDSVSDLVAEIKQRDTESGLSRTVAGFSWDWVSNKKGQEYLMDIKIGDAELKWNAVNENWINTDNAINEIGCIHTTQGYDLNYAGIIFGNEISYDKDKNEIVIIKENYKDTTGRQANTLEQLKEYIINIYSTMMLRGIKGTYIYICDPNLREYFSRFIPVKTKSDLVKEVFFLPINEIKPFENAIPIYHLDAAAGEFSKKQKVEDMNWVHPPKSARVTKDHFSCKVIGESMNKVIPNESYAVFRKYNGGSRNGKIVLVEYFDKQDSEFGSCYTIKKYESKKQENDEGWEHESIILKPMSIDDGYEDIVLTSDELSSFKVIGVFEFVLK
ncbi:DNA/RNA helicase domain-containing protein [Aquimarina longa]|uniref:DNA/RNA helicase domain-containing protein n=1 Tax=Aquimarina longa TaxID=1080221 RepID=UPI000786441F|nr:DNA/RNA helicase domain-containing protein [Aquimarina longa]